MSHIGKILKKPICCTGWGIFTEQCTSLQFLIELSHLVRCPDVLLHIQIHARMNIWRRQMQLLMNKFQPNVLSKWCSVLYSPWVVLWNIWLWPYFQIFLGLTSSSRRWWLMRPSIKHSMSQRISKRYHLKLSLAVSSSPLLLYTIALLHEFWKLNVFQNSQPQELLMKEDFDRISIYWVLRERVQKTFNFKVYCDRALA